MRHSRRYTHKVLIYVWQSNRYGNNQILLKSIKCSSVLRLSCISIDYAKVVRSTSRSVGQITIFEEVRERKKERDSEIDLLIRQQVFQFTGVGNYKIFRWT